ncbi:amidase [Leptolyngbya ohadii]|uniref:amidase n=1 Tax=Leptolyngbya ohadii TaxID=1962290 RepID=UPI000B59B313|nr:amidase [Leptolyngbya ohadii]
MNAVDLAFTSAIDLARLIRAKEISPLELTELYLERIERLNPQLGSFFTVTGDRALSDAKVKTDQLMAAANPAELPPFFGVPTAIKDLTAVAETPCSYGLSVIRNRIEAQDAGVVTRLRDAGFILLGKTATPQLGSTPYTEAKGFPPTRNPWNLDYTPGGSSGGASSAVAAGLCPVAHGTDGGGSIRGPAACCGIVGIKPSRGRVSMAPVGDRLSGLAVDGPLGRTVADAAAMLDIMAGYTMGDPYWLPNPNPSFLAAAGRVPQSCKIAYVTDFPPIGSADPLCQQAVLDTAKRLEQCGHSIEPLTLDFTEIIEPLVTVWQAGVDVGVPWLVLSRFNRWLLRQAKRRSSGQYLQAVSKMQTAARQIVAAFSPYDAVILPVFMHPTIRIGEWKSLSPQKTLQQIMNWVAPCPPINATGQPAIALPALFPESGLPIGIQLVGRPAGEEMIIALAAQLETIFPWHDRKPAIGLEG